MINTNKFYVGAMIGKCKNCGFQVQIRQPWLSFVPVVNDGWYLIHCTNKMCHNYFGMEIRENELSYADFLEKFPNLDNQMEKNCCKIIPFSIKRKQLFQ